MHLVVWNAGCLTRHSSSTAYSDRLFVAHFAVITFGLAALLDTWRDPLHSLYVAFGLSALLALVFIGTASRAKRHLAFTLQQWDALFVGCPRGTRRAWALRELLKFIRRAHLSCGAPPRLALNDGFPKGGGSMHRIAHRALALFIFNFRR